MGESKRPTKKQLKTTAFRNKKKIKELIEDKSQPLPEQDEEVENEEDNKKASSSSSSKKRKREKESTVQVAENEEEEEEEDGKITTTASKRRKRKNAAKLKEKEDIEKRKNSKLILFIGNLPFDISVQRLKNFFSEHCGEEPSVRLMTSKTSQPSDAKPTTKGCGFIEFQTSAALQKALRLHHTPLSAETEGPTNTRENLEKKARKINIELTAGGGGTSENRRKKIQQSHLRLAKQRDKIIEKRIKSSALEKASNPDGKPTDSEFDVSIKHGSRPNPHKKSRTPQTIPTRFKPHFSGPNAIKLG